MKMLKEEDFVAWAQTAIEYVQQNRNYTLVIRGKSHRSVTQSFKFTKFIEELGYVSHSCSAKALTLSILGH